MPNAGQRLKSAEILIARVAESMAKFDAIDGTLRNGAYAGEIQKQIKWGRQDLLLRMGGGKIDLMDGILLDELFELEIVRQNNIESLSDEFCQRREELMTQIIDKIADNDPALHKNDLLPA